MRGLLFKPEMTLANLNGTKTRTSRLYGLKKINEKPDEWKLIAEVTLSEGIAWFENLKTHDLIRVKCPFGQVGSELYGKETYDPLMNAQHTAVEKVIYKVDFPEEALKNEACDFGPWKSPMMMPESASRYHLILNRIIAQRIQEISESDAKAEGVEPLNYHAVTKHGQHYRESFIETWDSINPEYPWEKNPWVWGLYYTVKLKEAVCV